MAIFAHLQAASTRLFGRKPLTFFGASSANVYEMELCDLVNEAAEDIAQYQDWQALVRFANITGDGGADYPLPPDYGRQMQFADMQDTNTWFWGFQRFIDINDFTFAKKRNFTPYPGGWILYGNQIHFAPAPYTGAEATYPYITNQWAIDANGTPKSAFTADTDSFVLPERLLTLWMVWRWRANKGLASDGDEAAFAKAISEYGTKDNGSRVIRFNRSGCHRYGSVPYSGIAYY